MAIPAQLSRNQNESEHSHHEGPSAAKPQPTNQDNFHHEGTKITKENFSRKGAKTPRKYELSFRPKGEIFLKSLAFHSG
jgi:hypothetical protein